MEYVFLAVVATRGRIVALPQPLRVYRHRDRSVGQSERENLRWFANVRRGFAIKRQLLRTALQAPLTIGRRSGSSA